MRSRQQLGWRKHFSILLKWWKSILSAINFLFEKLHRVCLWWFLLYIFLRWCEARFPKFISWLVRIWWFLLWCCWRWNIDFWESHFRFLVLNFHIIWLHFWGLVPLLFCRCWGLSWNLHTRFMRVRNRWILWFVNSKNRLVRFSLLNFTRKRIV